MSYNKTKYSEEMINTCQNKDYHAPTIYISHKTYTDW